LVSELQSIWIPSSLVWEREGEREREEDWERESERDVEYGYSFNNGCFTNKILPNLNVFLTVQQEIIF
jgi:hypothetical protein